MREIKFRYVCKDASGNVFTSFLTLDYLERGKCNIEIDGRIQEILARNEYTGLHDSDNKEEYFGDIIEDDDGVRYVIEDGDSAVLFKNIKTGAISFFWHLMKPHRIIGNIWENKELLGEK